MSKELCCWFACERGGLISCEKGSHARVICFKRFGVQRACQKTMFCLRRGCDLARRREVFVRCVVTFFGCAYGWDLWVVGESRVEIVRNIARLCFSGVRAMGGMGIFSFCWSCGDHA